MCDSFIVKNFRTFKELKIPKLSKINLFIGNNSVGKTALLEALYLYFNHDKEQAIFQLISKREEHFEENTELGFVIRHLFYKHQLPDIAEDGILLSPLTQTGKIAKKHQTHISVGLESHDGENEKLINKSVVLIIDNKGEKEEYPLNEADFFNFHRRDRLYRARGRFYRERTSNNREAIKLEFVYSTGITDDNITTSLWDKISLTDKEEQVIEALQIIEPNLLRVNFVGSGERYEKQRVAEALVGKEKIPFKSMGDGINRLFYIVLSLINAQGGCLLIDEFENGLHYSVQKKVWNIIFTLAEKFDVQVFATTHSDDCIKAFGSHWNQNKDFATLHRIDYENNEHSAMSYIFEDLNDALSTNTEVR